MLQNSYDCKTGEGMKVEPENNGLYHEFRKTERERNVRFYQLHSLFGWGLFVSMLWPCVIAEENMSNCSLSRNNHFTKLTLWQNENPKERKEKKKKKNMHKVGIQSTGADTLIHMDKGEKKTE